MKTIFDEMWYIIEYLLMNIIYFLIALNEKNPRQEQYLSYWLNSKETQVGTDSLHQPYMCSKNELCEVTSVMCLHPHQKMIMSLYDFTIFDT